MMLMWCWVMSEKNVLPGSTFIRHPFPHALTHTLTYSWIGLSLNSRRRKIVLKETSSYQVGRRLSRSLVKDFFLFVFSGLTTDATPPWQWTETTRRRTRQDKSQTNSTNHAATRVARHCCMVCRTQATLSITCSARSIKFRLSSCWLTEK